MVRRTFVFRSSPMLLASALALALALGIGGGGTGCSRRKAEPVASPAAAASPSSTGTSDLLMSTGKLAPDPSLPQATPATTFTFRLPGEPETLDWNRAHTTVENYILMNLMEGLVAFDSKMNVVPSAAESWKISDDGRTYTFRLRGDVLWSDGKPLRAQDFVYSWKRLLSPLTAASYAYLLFDVEGAEFFNKGKLKSFDDVGVKALDERTLQVRLIRPVSYWIQLPTFWVTFPLRQDIIERHGESWARPGRMVTTGPFVLTAHEMDQRVVLTRNPHYKGARGGVEQVVGLIVKDDATAMNLFESGRIDYLPEIGSADVQRLKGDPRLKVYPYLKTQYLGLTSTRFPSSNVHFRRAVAMAIDKSKFGQLLMGGQTAATTFVPPQVLGHSARVGLPFDPAAARRELQLSGVKSGGGAVELLLLSRNWDKPAMVSQYIQEQLRRNLGLEVRLATYDHKSYRAQMDVFSHPLFEASWGADYPDPDNFLSMFLSNSGNNRVNWKSPQYDELVLEGRNFLRPEQREPRYLDAQRLIQEKEALIVPLFYDTNLALVASRVRGVELNSLNYLYFRNIDLAR